MSKSIEQEINSFLEIWGVDEMSDFLKDIEPLIELYDVDEDTDWVKEKVGEENVQNVRLIRTAYLISKFAENHSGRLSRIRSNFKGFWQRLEEF